MVLAQLCSDILPPTESLAECACKKSINQTEQKAVSMPVICVGISTQKQEPARHDSEAPAVSHAGDITECLSPNAEMTMRRSAM